MTTAKIEDFGGAGDGVTDNTPALNAAIAALVHKLEFGPGEYVFNSQPNPITNGMILEGLSPSRTVLIAKYGPWQDFITFEEGNGAGIKRMTLQAGDGWSLDRALVLQDNQYGVPNYFVAEDLVINGAGTGKWKFCLCIWARGWPGGVRDTVLRNVVLFNGTTTGAAWMQEVVGLQWFGGATFVGGGSNADVWLDGTGSQLVDEVELFGVNFQGSLHLSDCRNVNVYSTVPIVNWGNASWRQV